MEIFSSEVKIREESLYGVLLGRCADALGSEWKAPEYRLEQRGGAAGAQSMGALFAVLLRTNIGIS